MDQNGCLRRATFELENEDLDWNGGAGGRQSKEIGKGMGAVHRKPAWPRSEGLDCENIGSYSFKLDDVRLGRTLISTEVMGKKEKEGKLTMQTLNQVPILDNMENT